MESIRNHHNPSKSPVWKYGVLALLVFVNILIASAFSGCKNNQLPLISLNKQNKPLFEVLEEISNQSEYDLIGDLGLLENAGDVTIVVSNRPLKEVLRILTVNQGFDAEIQNETIVIVPR